MTVAASQQVALDTFTRTAANGFGAADVGGTWTVTLPASISVDGSAGRVSVTPGSGPSAFLNTVSAANVDATVDIESDKVGTGGGIYQSLIVRRVGTSDYRLKVRITATTVELYLVRTVNGTETTLAAADGPGSRVPARAGLAPPAAGHRRGTDDVAGQVVDRRPARAGHLERDGH